MRSGWTNHTIKQYSMDAIPTTKAIQSNNERKAGVRGEVELLVQ